MSLVLLFMTFGSLSKNFQSQNEHAREYFLSEIMATSNKYVFENVLLNENVKKQWKFWIFENVWK